MRCIPELIEKFSVENPLAVIVITLSLLRRLYLADVMMDVRQGISDLCVQ